MTPQRAGLMTGVAVAAVLLLAMAGVVAAQDPTGDTPSPSGVAGMMGGQDGTGMMGGQDGTGMMGGQMSAMTAGQLAQMATLHDQMIESGVCDQARMQALHGRVRAPR